MLIEVPGASDFGQVSNFTSELRQIKVDDQILLDFQHVGFATPSWLAVIGGALRQLKRDHPTLKRKVINYQHLTYAAHMGFFDYFGVKFGLPQGATGSDT